jgi:hypothetical protein
MGCVLGRYAPSALYPLLRYVNRTLAGDYTFKPM